MSNDFFKFLFVMILMLLINRTEVKLLDLTAFTWKFFLHGGLRLFVHIGIIFNLFVKYCST